MAGTLEMASCPHLALGAGHDSALELTYGERGHHPVPCWPRSGPALFTSLFVRACHVASPHLREGGTDATLWSGMCTQEWEDSLVASTGGNEPPYARHNARH